MSSEMSHYCFQSSTEESVYPTTELNQSNTSCPQNQQQIHRKPCKKRKRSRSTYTSSQLIQLENEFKRNMYLERIERIKIAQRLSLLETQVKIWFQNRRMKHKRGHKYNDQRPISYFQNPALQTAVQQVNANLDSIQTTQADKPEPLPAFNEFLDRLLENSPKGVNTDLSEINPSNLFLSFEIENTKPLPQMWSVNVTEGINNNNANVHTVQPQIQSDTTSFQIFPAMPTPAMNLLLGESLVEAQINPSELLFKRDIQNNN